MLLIRGSIGDPVEHPSDQTDQDHENQQKVQRVSENLMVVFLHRPGVLFISTEHGWKGISQLTKVSIQTP